MTASPQGAAIASTSNIDSSAPYSWRRLGKNEIRLITISEPATEPTTLQAHLSIFRRLHAPAYVGISYAWGLEDASKVILLNGCTHYIRPNLWNCLDNVYHHTPHGSSYLWVNSLCINQRDLTERNAQVRRMGSTFSKARLVISWLGLEPDEFEDTIFVTIFAPVCDSHTPLWNLEDHILELAKRPYWTRRWVVQEILLAAGYSSKRGKGHVICPTSPMIQFLCGSHIITWTQFQRCFDAHAHVTALRISPARAFVEGIVSSRASSTLSNLEFLLGHFRTTACRDPRDQVFALLPLLAPEKRAIYGSDLPDYSLTYKQVVTIVLARKPLSSVSDDELPPCGGYLFRGVGYYLGVFGKFEWAQLLQAAGWDFEFPDILTAPEEYDSWIYLDQDGAGRL